MQKGLFVHWKTPQKIDKSLYGYVFLLWDFSISHYVFLSVWLCVRDSAIQMKSWWKADWGTVQEGDGPCVVLVIHYLLFSGPLWLCAALLWLCLLSVACNQLLFLSLLRRTWQSGGVHSFFVPARAGKTLERTPIVNTNSISGLITMITWAHMNI